MGVYFELVQQAGSYYIVGHLDIIWLVVGGVVLALWRMLAGRHGGGRRY